MTTILERAKQLIERGYTPLPLNGKAPTINGWQEIPAPTLDTLKQWDKTGKLHNLGLRTGDNGLVVLDFDGLGGYDAFIEAFPDYLLTHTVKTGSGNGMHVYLTVSGELPKTTGVLNVPGGHLEIKAKGRQVVIPPSIHPDTKQPYIVSVSNPIKVITSFAAIQAWIDSHNPKPVRNQPEIPDSSPAAPGSKAEYAKAALANMAGQLAALSNVEFDDQNVTCNKMAWKAAHFVRMGDLSESEVKNALTGAMTANGYIAAYGHKAFEKTFASGFQDGFGDGAFIPEVYKRPAKTEWQEQRKPARVLPGQAAYTPPPKSEGGVTIIGRTRIIKRTSLFDDLSDRIQDDEYTPQYPPIIFPLRCLHHLGGQARVTQPGKIIIAAGASGSGKTSALETIADAYVENGVLTWIWTPEWRPDELAERAVQRHGGVTQDDLYLHEINKYRVNTLKQPSNEQFNLSDKQRTDSSLAIRTLRSWKEDVHFVENALLSVDELAEVMEQAKTVCNPFPRVLICDYAQMLKANDVEQEDSGMYALVQRFKNVCIQYGLVGWLATQTTKAEAKATQSKEGSFKGTTVINVTKNSRGKKGRVRVMSEPERLRILDQADADQTFDQSDNFLGSQSGRWLNDDAANLWLTINPEYYQGTYEQTESAQ